MARKASDYANAILQSRGLITVAARALGCTRQAIYSALERHPTVRAALTEARERTTDFAEGALFKAMADGDVRAIIYYLDCHGAQRGYIKQPLDVRRLQDVDYSSLPDADLDELASGTVPAHLQN